MLPFVGVILGVVLGEYLLVRSRLQEHHHEYIARALRRQWLLVSVVFLIQISVAVLVFANLSALRPTIQGSPLLGSLSGLLVGALIAYGLLGSEVALARSQDPREKAWTRAVFQLLLKSRLAVLQAFERSIQESVENDNFAWQQGDWDLGINQKEIGRRIRKLYEFHKYSFAAQDRRDFLLFSDVDHYPGRKFYLLAKNLGPSRLKQLLRDVVEPPSPNWSGKERRTRKSYPVNLTQPPQQSRRIYDDPELLRRIREGKTEKSSPRLVLDTSNGC